MADEPIDYNGWLSRTPGNEAPTTPLSGGNTESKLEWKDYVFRENGGSGYKSSLNNLLRSFKILGPGNTLFAVPDDTIGLVYVSRPMLNLSDDNVKKHPQLLPLVNPPRDSYMSYIKGLLDPAWGSANYNQLSILDPLNPWMVPLSNFLKVSSGFPDISLASGKSEPGFRGEVHAYVDGLVKVNYDYDMRQSYFLTKPNIISYLFEVWIHYIEAVTVGDEGMQPYFEALRCNYLDYTTRIYHIILNKDQRNIENIFCCGGGWPTTFPSGAFSTIDRTQDTLRGQGQDELDVNFTCTVFRFGNLEVADMFNRTTLRLNPNMHPSVRSRYYRKLEFSEYYLKKDDAYPWINLASMEMEYWRKV